MNSDGKNADDEASRLPEESSSNNIEEEQSQQANINNIVTTTSSSDLSQSSTKNNFNSDKNAITSPTTTVTTPTRNNDTPDMKRTAVKELIERYFYQLQKGCGNPKCTNKYCASSGEVEQMTPNQIAARAIQLFSQDAKLCDSYSQPSKVARTSADMNEVPSSSSQLPSPSTKSKTISNNEAHTQPSTSSHFQLNPDLFLTKNKKSCENISSLSSPSPKYLDEKIIDDLLEKCKQQNSYTELTQALDGTFSSFESLSKSFVHQETEAINKLLEKAGKSDLKSMKKEDLRTLEGETDKDEDSSAEIEEKPKDPSDTTVDLLSLRRSLIKLFKLDNSAIVDSINGAIDGLFIGLSGDLRLKKTNNYLEEGMLHCFVIAFEIARAAPDYIERALPTVCKAASLLSVTLRARLAKIWAKHSKDNLHSLIISLQQLITLEVIIDSGPVQGNAYITAATKTLKIVFYANILAGQLESTKAADAELDDAPANAEDDDYFFYQQPTKPLSQKFPEDKLEAELGVSAIDCRVPLVPFEEFYNEPLSDEIQMDRDYLAYKNLLLDANGEEFDFTFMLYSFILTPAKKVIALYYDSRIRMYSERNLSMFTAVNYFGGDNEIGPRPYLKLKVRREHIIDDALVELEMVAMGSPKDFKKQLVVEFVGEQGIDEGGVSKEFFQLVVEEIFNPDFGMFTYQEDTKTVWFNSSPFENEAQFTLIGIVLGLAIYNNIILAVNFPMVVYRKLMGGHGSFYDLADWNPTLYRSLKSMLDYDGSDMEDIFMQTFKITYSNVFGETVEHELKANGDDIAVNQENKQEFVDLYSDFLLNKSIERQFKAFKKGFEMVTDESPLKLLFRPEEIELLVCGSRNFDFVELEKSTEYEGGYTSDSQIIKDFWSIVHSLPDESKRKLLEFTTGSDRVPVGGLSRLKLLITRHGSDSDRLPTSHTCFNVLLLPEYSNREKLEERLLKAINYSKGFGML
ncbi:ubiquitin-protein ligase E3A isoform X2 [Episyrphus balteatus]|uniref:ubiquitin-protein ligase E3A isoform X2 n=1 Tax=Episyrphus balteatus TaxID=286459 RepID=UPI002486BD52|nr:ubiquitin-protein ligase E3A isoform X2 [Episyrphus balteatus]